MPFTMPLMNFQNRVHPGSNPAYVLSSRHLILKRLQNHPSFDPSSCSRLTRSLVGWLAGPLVAPVLEFGRRDGDEGHDEKEKARGVVPPGLSLRL